MTADTQHLPLTKDEKIGRVIAAVLDLTGMQQAYLAALIGMKPSTLSNKINGLRPWKSSEVERVAQALGVPEPMLGRDPAAILEELRRQFVNYRSA